jgi:hypothetical protein
MANEAIDSLDLPSIGAAPMLTIASTLDRKNYHAAAADHRFGPGVILPAGSADGASSAFDGTKPIKATINPSEQGHGGFSLDLSQLTTEQQNAAYRAAKAKFPTDSKACALAAYATMADMVTRLSAKTVVAAAPAVKTRKPAAAGVEPILASVYRQTEGDNQVSQQAKKLRRVDFELPRPYGTITCNYHDVVRTSSLLILIHELAAGGMKWFPQPAEADEDPVAIGVLVYDEDGNPDTAFAAMGTPVKFVYSGLEFCVMAIDAERPCQPEAEVRSEQDQFHQSPS